ncbi:uncharacterized protein [Dermacentor andersoni]|uniref:uncharacterized protein n=1 Tax=Dermacentor andersoni TaxID=34620 RepID=UPI003B3BB1D4
MGTLTAEKLADAFLIEGRMWLDRKGKYAWTEHTKRSFRERLACLKKKNSQPENSGETSEVNSQEGFERRGDDNTLSLKVFDHIGLRTSYNEFIEMISESGKCRADFQRVSIQTLQRDFFTSFAKRHCGPEGDHETEYRVNFALRTYREFALTFNCRDGQMMKSEDDCDIEPHGQLCKARTVNVFSG